MKHKKALIYLLGFLVICIWGMIILRVYARVGDDQGQEVTGVAHRSPVKIYIPLMQPDTFHLLLNYPDPFKEKGVAMADESPKSVLPLQTGMPVVRPVILPVAHPVTTKYLGYVWNAESKKKVAILNQNGREMMMEVGETTDQLQLVVIAADSVKIKFKGKTSFISISK